MFENIRLWSKSNFITAAFIAVSMYWDIHIGAASLEAFFMDSTFIHMIFQLAIVVWFQLDCFASLALHTGTISEMPRKIEI